MTPRFMFEMALAITNPQGVKTMAVDYMEDDVSIEDIREVQGSVIGLAEARRQKGAASKGDKAPTTTTKQGN